MQINAGLQQWSVAGVQAGCSLARLSLVAVAACPWQPAAGCTGSSPPGVSPGPWSTGWRGSLERLLVAPYKPGGGGIEKDGMLPMCTFCTVYKNNFSLIKTSLVQNMA